MVCLGSWQSNKFIKQKDGIMDAGTGPSRVSRQQEGRCNTGAGTTTPPHRWCQDKVGHIHTLSQTLFWRPQGNSKAGQPRINLHSAWSAEVTTLKITYSNDQRYCETQEYLAMTELCLKWALWELGMTRQWPWWSNITTNLSRLTTAYDWSKLIVFTD